MRRLTLLVVVLAVSVGPACAQSGGDIVISEVMPDPDAVANSEGEYIELYNTTSNDIALTDWTLDLDGDTDDLSDVTVPGKGFAVLCIDDNSADNGGIEACDLDYPDEFSLINSGSTIVITDDGGTEIDRVAYDESTWPVVNGASMEYTGGPYDNNNDPTNWQEATTRKGDFAGDEGDFGSPNANASGGALPVELSAFTVAVDARSAVVKWTTATETNNAHFAVQHRGPSSTAYRTLGTREGAGTTARPQSYRFRVRRLEPGTHTFRLRQVDLDGTAHLSAPRAIEVLPDASLSLVGPNPLRSGERLTAVVSGEKSRGPVRIHLYNVLGQRVRTVAAPIEQEGPVRVHVSTRDLASGTYFLRAAGPALSESARFTVVR
jgi:hypothetical protein